MNFVPPAPAPALPVKEIILNNLMKLSMPPM